jgi:outer membrane protein OmpA-like peptidoglycan-associated protein
MGTGRSMTASMSFAECSTDLSPESQDRVLKLAEALRERPAMKVDAIGYVDREADGKACRARTEVETGPGPLDGEASMKQLAEGRAVAVRNFLRAPVRKDDRQARVEFAPAGD